MNKEICKQLGIEVANLNEMSDEEREEYEAEVHARLCFGADYASEEEAS